MSESSSLKLPADVVASRWKGDAGREAGQIVDAAQSLNIEFLLGKGRCADGDILQPLGATSRSHHDFLEAGACPTACRPRSPWRHREARRARKGNECDCRSPRRSPPSVPSCWHDVSRSRLPLDALIAGHRAGLDCRTSKTPDDRGHKRAILDNWAKLIHQLTRGKTLRNLEHAARVRGCGADRELCVGGR